MKLYATIPFALLCVFVKLTDDFDFNLRFLILIVAYDSLICISAVPYRTARGPSGIKWAAAGAHERRF